MNFYFCERCGRRVTEADLARGEAKDKKLKGVFCTECSAGVMTMEMQPLSTAQAREILGQTTKPAKAAGQAPSREVPSRRLSSAQKEINLSDLQPSAQHAHPIFIVAGALLALATGIWLLWSSPGGKERSLEIGPSTRIPPPKIVSSEPPALAAPRPPVSRPSSAPAPASVDQPKAVEENVSPERRAQAAFDELIKFEGLGVEDQKGRADRIQAFLMEHGEAIVAARARVLLQELTAPPDSTPPAKPSAPSTPSAPSAPSAPITPSAPAVQAAPPAGSEQPVAHWKLDEGTGTTALDASGNNLSGTLQGGATWTLSGVQGGALNLDGKNGYVALPESAALNIASDITFAMWMKTSSTKHSMIVGGLSASSPYAGYGLDLNHPQREGRISYWNGRAWVSSTSTNYNDGAWHHLAVSVSETKATFYKDGEPDGSSTSGRPNSWSGVRALGRQSTANYDFLAGSLDDVRIYNRALSAEEIAALAKGGSGPAPPSIVTQPANRTVTAGQTATFAVAATGAAPLNYQWQKKGVGNIAGATGASFTTPSATQADSGSVFRVKVSNAKGSVMSATATLTVLAPAARP